MTVDEFAQKVKTKYPQYQKLDNQTLTSKMIEKYPQYKDHVDQTPITNSVMGEYGKTGISKVPVLGGVLGGMISPITQFADSTIQSGQHLTNVAKTNPQAAVSEWEKNYKPNAAGPVLGGIADLISGKKGTQAALPAALDISSTAATAMDLPAILGGVKTAATAIPKYATKGSTFKAMANAASKGGDISWESVASAARDQVKNLGTSVKGELEKLIAEESPITSSRVGTTLVDQNVPEAANTLSSSQALELRGGLGKRMPSNFFETAISKAMSGGQSVPRNQATDALRRAVSSELKKAAPEIATPDKMYAFYSKIGGDAPTWIKRAVGGLIADKLIGKKFGGPVEGLVDAMGTLIGNSF